MTSSAHIRCLAAVVTIALGAAACGREEPPPATTVVSQTPERPVTMPTTVTGCLRAGETENTFVLTAAQTAGEETATYHLLGTEDKDLGEHVGRRVEISGVLTSRQAVAMRSPADPVPDATGTGGQTPAVSTTTELAVKELQVQEVRPLEGECEPR